MTKQLFIKIKAGLYCLKQIPLAYISNKSIKEDNIKTLTVSADDISYFNLSSNCITIIDAGEQIFFFRECRMHAKRNNYFHDALMRFSEIALKGRSIYSFTQKVNIDTSFSETYVAEFMEYIRKCERNQKFYKKIADTDAYMKAIGFYVWGKEKQYFVPDYVLKLIGLTEFPDKFRKILPLFLLYVRGIAYSYRMNCFLKKGSPETFNASKMLGSWAVAHLLECEELLVSSEYIILESEGVKRRGVLCEAAPGFRAQDCECEITPLLQKQLTNLQILDLLCYQKDHGVNNYNIVFEKDVPISVCAFDNDNPYTFWPLGGVTFCGKGADQPMLSHGKINLPYIDESMADKIKQLDEKRVKQCLKPYLNSKQLFAFCMRLKNLQKALLKSDGIKFLTGDQWSDDTLTEELNGSYGKTYLWLLENRKNE